MAEANSPGTRILIGAASFADAAAALRIVERLPSIFRASLGGILVEDVETLSICQIPDQRVVLLSGATMLAPNLAQVRTLLDADARAFRQSLAQTAEPTSAEWVFARARGNLINTTLHAVADWDILVIGHRRIHAVPGKIVLLKSSGSSSAQMDEAFNQLIGPSSAGRVVITVNPEGDRTGHVEGSGARQFLSLDEAMGTLARMNAEAVLVDLAHGPVRDSGDLACLLDAARCPVLVFGASGTNIMIEHSTQIPPAPSSGGHDDGD